MSFRNCLSVRLGSRAWLATGNRIQTSRDRLDVERLLEVTGAEVEGHRHEVQDFKQEHEI